MLLIKKIKVIIYVAFICSCSAFASPLFTVKDGKFEINQIFRKNQQLVLDSIELAYYIGGKYQAEFKDRISENAKSGQQHRLAAWKSAKILACLEFGDKCDVQALAKKLEVEVSDFDDVYKMDKTTQLAEHRKDIQRLLDEKNSIEADLRRDYHDISQLGAIRYFKSHYGVEVRPFFGKTGYHNETLPDGRHDAIPGIIATNINKNLIVISFAGSKSEMDWNVNAQAVKDELKLATGVDTDHEIAFERSSFIDQTIYGHYGFVHKMKSFQASLKEQLTDILEKAPADFKKNVVLIVTGHSQGGALAGLTALDLMDYFHGRSDLLEEDSESFYKNRKNRIWLYTVSAPRVFSERANVNSDVSSDSDEAEYVNELLGPSIRHVAGCDSVPYIPFKAWGFRHIGSLAYQGAASVQGSSLRQGGERFSAYVRSLADYKYVGAASASTVAFSLAGLAAVPFTFKTKILDVMMAGGAAAHFCGPDGFSSAMMARDLSKLLADGSQPSSLHSYLDAELAMYAAWRTPLGVSRGATASWGKVQSLTTGAIDAGWKRLPTTESAKSAFWNVAAQGYSWLPSLGGYYGSKTSVSENDSALSTPMSASPPLENNDDTEE